MDYCRDVVDASVRTSHGIPLNSRTTTGVRSGGERSRKLSKPVVRISKTALVLIGVVPVAIASFSCNEMTGDIVGDFCEFQPRPELSALNSKTGANWQCDDQQGWISQLQDAVAWDAVQEWCNYLNEMAPASLDPFFPDQETNADGDLIYVLAVDGLGDDCRPNVEWLSSFVNPTPASTTKSQPGPTPYCPHISSALFDLDKMNGSCSFTPCDRKCMNSYFYRQQLQQGACVAEIEAQEKGSGDCTCSPASGNPFRMTFVDSDLPSIDLMWGSGPPGQSNLVVSVGATCQLSYKLVGGDNRHNGSKIKLSAEDIMLICIGGPVSLSIVVVLLIKMNRNRKAKSDPESTEQTSASIYEDDDDVLLRS